ncbi:probable C-mannosyltransferase DPY19L1 [Achroia grisella]|uniref:probable C-mannosyltransferase DPY19L1 n=1 Tax=Achroia grisella TaxID=688607 RepID=UPI0027D266E2|nr:probable C-mannosyltransferase DPY19L1 [Achroia grisella]
MHENTDDTTEQPIKKKVPVKLVLKLVLIVFLALGLGYIHYRYVSHLFENDRNFSYLSEMEREMSFRTEMGFYYSYYKTVVEERPFVAAMSKLMYDRLVEYPKDVNAFNRFNIHPEVLIGSMYRYLEPLLNTSAHRQCHLVERGQGLAAVESCVGLGQPIMFYLEAVWWLAGLTVAGLFLHATALSESILGGGIAVAHYFANHAECTRVQWAPNERENMAAPLLLLQAWLVSLQLRDKDRRTTFQLQVSIFILNGLCLLFWQFTQFIFLTQTAIFFVMEQLKIIDLKSLCVFLHSHFCGLHMAVLLLQGNDMLKSSLFASFFVVVSVYCLFFSSLRIKVHNRLDLFVEAWLVVLRLAIVVCASFYLKKVISDFLEVQEDSHIWDILYSKFTNYKSFHTLIYTCSDVFDFLPWSSIKKMLHSFLIPFVLINILNVCNYWLFNAINASRKREIEDIRVETEKDNEEDTDDSGIENNAETIKNKNDTDKKCDVSTENEESVDGVVFFLKNLKIDAAVFYNMSQMAVYGVMAALVMRLKMLFTTQLCVISSLLMNRKYYQLPKRYMKYIPLLWVVVTLPLVQDLIGNVSHEMSHVGEFSDIPQEELLEWIKRETASGASFAGTMPLLATVMLACRRPIVAHPHYEHYDARERAYAVYKTYGRFSSQELYSELSKLRATYLIIEYKYCYGRSSKGCSFYEIWDIEAPEYRGRPRLCHILLTETVEHFFPMFRNDHYAVFRIHDVSVRYMPRSFDT